MKLFNGVFGPRAGGLHGELDNLQNDYDSAGHLRLRFLTDHSFLRPHQMEYRTIDGSHNNLKHANLNATGTDFTRIGPAHFPTASTPCTTVPIRA